ncbi:glycosyltransferase [Sporomusa sp.]|uniref:glycosyltransferase n=1 Tax=Sporomusa sp. TaxID=2078658 RepID=UPI002CCD3690|nr:glycosyltransferase [Sporomusa sp.]HWR45115.1 glycosyltransferase [Sporomusa sp.]
MNGTISISLCLITKNEEHCLARCLESVQQLVDEIIVVDTGSEDATVKIAAELGASVFFFHWVDDFSAARNYAISKAQGQWILVLDADEVLAPLSRQDLFAYMEHSPAEGYYFQIASYLDCGNKTVEDYVVRLFKNAPAYRFSGAIHEQVAGSIQSCNVHNGLVFAPYTIHHYGYLLKELEEKHKFDRNTTIISKALMKNPQDPFLHYSLAIEYLQHKDFKQAGLLLQKTLTLLRGEEGYILQVLMALLLTKLAEPDDTHAEALFSSALETLPDNGDLYCLYGVWLMQHNRFPEAAKVLEAALSKNIDLVEPGQLHSFLGDVYFLAGKIDQAIENYTTALSKTPVDLYPLARLLALWSNRSSLHLCNSILSRLTPEITMGLLQRATQAGRFDLAIAIILLAIIERTSAKDIPRIVAACTAYVQCLLTASPAHCLDTAVFTLLSQSGEELVLQSRLLEMSGGHSTKVQQALIAGALQNLLLISTVVQRCFPTDPVKFWKGVFIDETRFDCQSH